MVHWQPRWTHRPGKYQKEMTTYFVPGSGRWQVHKGASFNPLDMGRIGGQLGFLFCFFILLPVFVGLVITVLQWVFPWWPR